MSPHSSVVFRQAFPPDSPSRVSTFSRCMSTLSITLFHLFVSQHSPDVCQHSLLPCSTYSCLHILQMYVNTLSYPVPLIRVSTLSRCMSTFSLTLFHLPIRVSTLSRCMSTLSLTLFHLFVSPHSPDVCQHSLLPCSTCRVSTLSRSMSTLFLTLFHLVMSPHSPLYVNTLSYPVSPSRVSTLSRCMSTFSLTLFHLVVSPHSLVACQQPVRPVSPSRVFISSMPGNNNNLLLPIPLVVSPTLQLCVNNLLGQFP